MIVIEPSGPTLLTPDPALHAPNADNETPSVDMLSRRLIRFEKLGDCCKTLDSAPIVRH
jgi:hypothetical protein